MCDVMCDSKNTYKNKFSLAFTTEKDIKFLFENV